jgi:cyclopropane fatty-acyl-phospholipid synthase-like methyltransferase
MPEKSLNKLLNLLGWCPYCEKFFHYPKRRRLCTQYANEEDNWVTCCEEQFNEINDYYKERWQDYWSDIRAGLY